MLPRMKPSRSRRGPRSNPPTLVRGGRVARHVAKEGFLIGHEPLGLGSLARLVLLKASEEAAVVQRLDGKRRELDASGVAVGSGLGEEFGIGQHGHLSGQAA